MLYLSQKTTHFYVLMAVAMLLSSCATTHRTMREPNILLNLKKDDFTLSEQKVAQAKSVKIIGIDFRRIFRDKTGSLTNGVLNIDATLIPNIPIVGNLAVDKTSNYALYQLMQQNPGYDVVFYPQYETRVMRPILGIGILCKITTAKVTARLATLKP